VKDWLIVLRDRKSIEWVVDHSQMAFRPTVNTSGISPGDRFVLYAALNALSNRPGEQSRVFAFGAFLSVPKDEELEVAGKRYSQSCPIRIDLAVPPKQGAVFASHLANLAFVKNKTHWAGYVHRTLAALMPGDFEVLRRVIEQSGGSSFPAQRVAPSGPGLPFGRVRTDAPG